MFTADAIIDTVQTGKKTLVNTFVTNETIKDSMIKFIDTQTEYTKSTIKAFSDVGTQVMALTYNKNFGKELAESYGIEVPTFGKKVKAASKKAD